VLTSFAIPEAYLDNAGTYLLAPASLTQHPTHDLHLKIPRFSLVSGDVFIEAGSSPSLSVFLRFYSTIVWCGALDKRQLFIAFTLVHAVNDKFVSEVTVTAKVTD